MSLGSWTRQSFGEAQNKYQASQDRIGWGLPPLILPFIYKHPTNKESTFTTPAQIKTVLAMAGHSIITCSVMMHLNTEMQRDQPRHQKPPTTSILVNRSGSSNWLSVLVQPHNLIHSPCTNRANKATRWVSYWTCSYSLRLLILQRLLLQRSSLTLLKFKTQEQLTWRYSINLGSLVAILSTLFRNLYGCGRRRIYFTRISR